MSYKFKKSYEKIYKWKFLRKGFKSVNGDLKWEIDKWNKVESELSMCENGLHCSRNIFDVFYYVKDEEGWLTKMLKKFKMIKVDKKNMKKNIYKTTDLEKEINKEIDKIQYDFFAYEDITDPKSIYNLFDDFKKWAFNFIKRKEKKQDFIYQFRMAGKDIQISDVLSYPASGLNPNKVYLVEVRNCP